MEKIKQALKTHQINQYRGNSARVELNGLFREYQSALWVGSRQGSIIMQDAKPLDIVLNNTLDLLRDPNEAQLTTFVDASRTLLSMIAHALEIAQGICGAVPPQGPLAYRKIQMRRPLQGVWKGSAKFPELVSYHDRDAVNLAVSSKSLPPQGELMKDTWGSTSIAVETVVITVLGALHDIKKKFIYKKSSSLRLHRNTILYLLSSLNPATGVMEDRSWSSFTSGIDVHPGPPTASLDCFHRASTHPPGPIHQPGVQLEAGVRVKMWG
ncbi:hypothetical protein EV426DRAFT_641438 [Tirmania nivea]|nr:hypothetical protein EV426DRAFT_641438 [Tirmania nivea]